MSCSMSSFLLSNSLNILETDCVGMTSVSLSLREDTTLSSGATVSGTGTISGAGLISCTGTMVGCLLMTGSGCGSGSGSFFRRNREAMKEP